jgi:hypothetical protein
MAKPSPFPGMDPWLEPMWGPVHHEYISHVRRQLAAQLPDDLYAQVEADVYVVDRDVRGRLVRPDAAAFSTGAPAKVAENGGTAAAVAEPIRVRVRRPVVTLTHVAIREPRNGDRLVTAVELFSPTNKNDPRDRQAYLDKRDAYLTGGANVVEIDLLRGGQDLMELAEDDLPPATGTRYQACVRLANPEIGDKAEYYPMPLRDRLPRIGVPLRAGDADVVLDLQQPITDVYATGRYDLQIDYAEKLTPPLPGEDAAWAAERIAAGR